MNLQNILPFIIGIILIIILFKIIKSLVKTALLVIVFLLIIGVIGGFFVFRDVQDLKENFFVQEKLFLLVDQDEVIQGFEATEFDFDTISFLGPSELSDIEKNYESGNYQEILGDYYKIIILKKELFSSNDDFANVTMSSGPLFIFKGYRDGKIIVYPQTSLFKAIKYLIVSTQKAKELISEK